MKQKLFEKLYEVSRKSQSSIRPRSFHCAIMHEREFFSQLKHSWDQLCEELAEHITIFASHAWYDCWLKYYKKEAELYLFTFWQGKKLVGVAPLIRGETSINGLRVKTIGFVENNQSLHNDFIVRPEIRKHFFNELVKYLFREKSLWDVIYFRNFDQTSNNRKALYDELDREKIKYREVSTPIKSPYILPLDSWQDYLKSRKRRTKKNIRSIRNRMHKAGNVSIKHITTAEEFLLHKEEIFSVAQKSWTEQYAESLGSKVNKDFYESLSLAFSEKGQLSIYVLFLDDRMIALEYHLRGFGREHALRGHYDPEFASLSPGSYLEASILEHIFEESARVKIYDFCGSFDIYKQKWADKYVPHCDLYIFNKTLKSRCALFHKFFIVPNVKTTLQKLKIIK